MATAATTSSPLNLPPLPYAENALEPVISAQTLSFHHGKHHRAYVESANKLIVGTELADLPLDSGAASRRQCSSTKWNLHSAASTHARKSCLKPLLAIDVWEHAYYLDYQNKRADHVNAVIDKLINWEFAAANLETFGQNQYR